MRRIFQVIGNQASAFHADRRGTFAVLAAVAASVLAASVGFSVNITQLYTVKSNLRAALDAAVTSTARDLTTGKIEAKDARARFDAFFKANGDPEFTPTDRVVLDELVVDQAARTVRATAHIDTQLFFDLFGEVAFRRVSEKSAALYSDKAIEVAMMLDVTGSMSGQKIKDLKTAAKDALDVFLDGQDPRKPRVRVAIVPYADAVNTGDLSDVVYAETNYTTGEPPALESPAAASAHGADDDCATERKGSQQFTDASPYTAMVSRDYRLSFCPSAALKPLSANLAGLKKAVEKFSANGSTAGHIGIQWSWYMLSPRWADVLPKAADPAPYNPKKVAKYAILMTDGEFNTAFAGVPKDGRTAGGQAALSGEDAGKLCKAMKTDGIEIFTVGFMLRDDTAKDVLAGCASPDTSAVEHYYDTADGDELRAAFLEIAHNIERLAITE